MSATGVKSCAAGLINLSAYPIDALETVAGRALVAACRDRLNETGALVLQGFLTDASAAAMAAQARALERAAHHYRTEHTVYFDPVDDGVPTSHPRCKTVRTDKGNVPYDLIPSTSQLRQFYEWDGLLTFVAAVLGEPRLYRHADPMAALNINVHGEGQQLGWHFDRTDFAITLSLQQSEGGGVFEYVANLRSDSEENYDGVADILAGGRDRVRELKAPPGTLTLFRGHHSLHRVTPSLGPSKRLMAALSYVREPDVGFSAYARKLFYGRETALTELA